MKVIDLERIRMRMKIRRYLNSFFLWSLMLCLALFFFTFAYGFIAVLLSGNVWKVMLIAFIGILVNFIGFHLTFLEDE